MGKKKVEIVYSQPQLYFYLVMKSNHDPFPLIRRSFDRLFKTWLFSCYSCIFILSTPKISFADCIQKLLATSCERRTLWMDGL